MILLLLRGPCPKRINTEEQMHEPVLVALGGQGSDMRDYFATAKGLAGCERQILATLWTEIVRYRFASKSSRRKKQSIDCLIRWV